MPYIAVALLIAGGIFLYWYLRKLDKMKKIWRDLDSLGIPKDKAQFKRDYITPKGVKVKSTVEVSGEALLRIDAGITAMIADQDRFFPQWQAKRDLKEYGVLFIDPMAVNVETDPGSPALMIKGVQTAGTTIGAQPYPASKVPYIVLPHQKDTNWSHLDYLETSAFNEGQHFREWFNEYDVWSYFTTVEDVHPHDYSRWAA